MEDNRSRPKMLTKVAEYVKEYWPIVTAMTFIFGLMFSGLRYYARAEAVELIKVEMVNPLKDLNDRANLVDQNIKNLDKNVNKLQQDIGKQDEKLNGVEKQLDIIIQLMRKPDNRTQ